MNSKHLDAIANAVLYEGYMLYPYRPSSVKNRQRFNFGVLYPQPYSDAQSGSDAWNMQTECLVQGNSLTDIEIRVRFLQLVTRSARKLAEPGLRSAATPAYENAPVVEVDGRIFTPWQEAIECEITVPPSNLEELERTPFEKRFAFSAKEETELLRDAKGRILGQIAREQESVCGVVEVRARREGNSIFKLQVRVKNLTSLDGEAHEVSRDRALLRSLVSAHVQLGATNGEFLSLLDPPEKLVELAAGCQNIGAWPVLVGAEGERDTMLASPIILYDYPQIAPESPGDLFDGTEIDEILALRILTMTDQEKSEMRNTDERARRILERTETLPMEQLMKLHGTLRELHPSDARSPQWQPEQEMP
jgi:hydrogenase maturation protease